MKILHTADWHIGKIVNEFSMIEDQQYILKQLFTLIEQELPDVIIIAGDIYDRSIPPKEAVELLDATLTKLSTEYKIPTMVIAGNHDSIERLNFGKKLFEQGNLFIEGKCDDNNCVRKIVINDEFGVVNFFLVPYISPTYARLLYDNHDLVDHQALMEFILNSIELNPHERNVLVNHNYFSSAKTEAMTSDSERSLSIGGAEVIPSELVKQFDYVALGHLHKPQKVGFDHVRYSGSLLKYSASEINTPKGIYFVEFKEKNNVDIVFKALKPLRDFIKIKGTLEEVTSKSFYSRFNQKDYVHAVLTDKKDLYNPLSQLRAIYPNVMHIERETLPIGLVEGINQETLKHKAPIEIFSDFYLYITGQELESTNYEEIKTLMEKLNERSDD